jgi:hypothetical protein
MTKNLGIDTCYDMGMHKPPHPGEIIKAFCIEALGLTVTKAAESLGVIRKAGTPGFFMGTPNMLWYNGRWLLRRAV